MKLIVLLALLSSCMFLSTGCATPAYSAQERDKLIARGWRYDRLQAVDDFDALLMLRTPSRLTVWHVR